MNCGNQNFLYPGVNMGAGGTMGTMGAATRMGNQMMAQPISLPQQGGQFGAQQLISGQQLGQGGATFMPSSALGQLTNISALGGGNGGNQPFGAQFGMTCGGAGGGGLTQLAGLGLGGGGGGTPISLAQLGGSGNGLAGLGQFPMLQMTGGGGVGMPQLQMAGLAGLCGGQQPIALHQMHGGGAEDFAHQLNLNAFHQGFGQQVVGQPGQQMTSQSAAMQKLNNSNGLLNMFRKA